MKDFSKQPKALVLIIVFVLGVLILTYLQRQEPIEVYSIPKEISAPLPNQILPTAYTLHLQAPKTWAEKEASGMRLYSYTIQGEGGASAEVSVIALPTPSGTLIDNINRWRGQLGLEPIAQAQIMEQVVEITVNELDFRTITIQSANPDGAITSARSSIIAMLTFANTDYFFKLIGQSELVESNQAAFTAFLNTIHLIPEENDHVHA
ncbi:MAG: hypothetical protein ACI9CF_000575 [Candidatus Omnitrophota bacterium]|jgi:hypothetical protein